MAEVIKKKRTPTQNNALHKFFELLADKLNEAGLDMKKTLKPEIDIPWTAINIKEYLWKPIQMVVLKKSSTKELERSKEIDQIYDILNRHLSEKFGLEVPPFPSIEELIKEEENKKL